jgi:hypothetical protein
MARIRSPVPFLLLIALPVSLSAQRTVTGLVRADSSGKPLVGAEVSVQGVKKPAVTNDSGRYVLRGLKAGTHVVQTRAVGYQAIATIVDLTSEGVHEHDITLTPITATLPPIVVTGRPPGPGGLGFQAFEERRRHGFGKFIDSAELRRNEHVRLGDLVGRAGVNVLRSRTGVFAMSKNIVGPFGERCPLSVILDGAVIFRSTGVTMQGSGGVPSAPPPDLNAILGTHELHAVEIYGSASEVPIEFGGRHAACGAVVLWTRRTR